MLQRRSFLFGLSSAVVIPAMARAAPLTLSGAGLIFTEIAFAGRKAKALIDSGSVRGLQLTQALAGMLGVRLSESSDRVQRYQGSSRPVLKGEIARLEVGGFAFERTEASVSPGDIETISGQISEPFDAILGWPLLSSRSFDIDYRSSDFSFRQAPAGGLSLPVETGNRLPLVAGSIGGRKATFLIDTGAPWSKIDPKLAGQAALGSRVELPFTIADRPFTTQFNVRDLGALSRGTGALAVIGHRFLRQFSLAWDQPSGQLRLI